MSVWLPLKLGQVMKKTTVVGLALVFRLGLVLLDVATLTCALALFPLPSLTFIGE